VALIWKHFRSIATIEQAEKWQKVLERLNSGEMPPRIPNNLKVEKADFLDELAQTMVSAATQVFG
jgi:hypothetical protein